METDEDRRKKGRKEDSAEAKPEERKEETEGTKRQRTPEEEVATFVKGNWVRAAGGELAKNR